MNTVISYKNSALTLFTLLTTLTSFSLFANTNDLNENSEYYQSLSPARQIEVCIVKGEQLKKLLNTPYQHYSLLALSKNGILSPIPYQFDDQNVNGLIHVAGGKIPVNGNEGILEPQDELAFMLKDAGNKASTPQLDNTAGQLIAELSVGLANGKQAFVYLFKDNPNRSEKVYTHYDTGTGLLTTGKFSQQFDPESILIWEDYFYSDFEEQRSLLDSAKIRIKIKLNLLKVTLNNRQLPSEIVAIKNGAIRSIIEMDASLSVFGKDIIAAGGNLTATENSLHFAVEATTPKAAAFIKDNLVIEYSYDFNKLDGMKFTSALASGQPVIAGSGAFKPDLNSISVDNSWFSGSTGKGWDFIGFFQSNESFSGGIELLFKDSSLNDEEDKPERMPGSHPQIGYYIKGVPAGAKFRFGIDFHYSSRFWENNGIKTAVDELKNPTLITIFFMPAPPTKAMAM